MAVSMMKTVRRSPPTSITVYTKATERSEKYRTRITEC